MQPFAPGRVISTAFPPGQVIHPDHFIAFGPDGWLYVPQGSESNTGPCAVYSANLTRCTINRMQPDGTSLEEYARGRAGQLKEEVRLCLRVWLGTSMLRCLC